MSSDFYKLTVNKAVKETDDCVSLSFDIPEEIKDKFGFISGQYLTLKTTINGEKLGVHTPCVQNLPLEFTKWRLNV